MHLYCVFILNISKYFNEDAFEEIKIDIDLIISPLDNVQDIFTICSVKLKACFDPYKCFKDNTTTVYEYSDQTYICKQMQYF